MKNRIPGFGLVLLDCKVQLGGALYSVGFTTHADPLEIDVVTGRH